MYEAVEVFVNIFQAFAITFYLIKCLGVKEGKNRKCAYITGVIVTVLYLEIMNRIIFFESVGVLIYLVVSLAFSAVFLCGNVAQKIMYNVVMMVAIVCAAMLGAGIVGVIKGTDFLKVGHHGSNTSSSEEFINSINPKYSLISVGKNNRYGHPNKEVLDTLNDSKIYRTDQDGSIMFKIKNNKLRIETYSP
mgnify:CR=1 FL=1